MTPAGDDATSTLVRRGVLTAGAALAAAAGITCYAAAEARNYQVTESVVPILPPGSRDVRLLQVSDLHLVPSQAAKISWLRDLASLSPDFVVDTGDNFGHADALWPLLFALEPLLAFPGAFVLGSNDYYAPSFRNPLRYLLGHSGTSVRRDREGNLPWRAFADELTAAGWLDLDNDRGRVAIGGSSLALVGLDDPHISLDALPASSKDDSSIAPADAKIGVVHAPYTRALSALKEDGADLILAGHTHGGQVCVPGYGALTTNCDIDTARASGLHGWPGARPGEPGGEDSTWLHVSQGVGSNPFVRLRLACRPAANVLILTAREQ
ncbi:metallophosphoesterase [Rarobacter faecitabidus]|uniref:Putative MPP superfamily phosphohydrolase n=1 Tax=Rarobacter faecitabidus TaxID=13243 RepID=A0A542ZTA7_RARFA|nr:metallophosphoesterase [Rarobacter faecitabidus]TQL63594.1 putative MPP superfamily phosphohydrolase [Rarobacter faecitabidus]